ncbi:unnamed protein product [Bursaphelenchus xylophilus]|uniref:Phosphatidylinositol-3-phosphatase SAC1 n=1 Tax=Bursaphelenchus xylophilus TaxID=6326 RepID=A0A1I7SBW4_BURXY|nr:unnamed protein product [Bursaphelenchus xylophilus]CAG9089180.1 unnamed protein product [Bursaphelenchus xylophilus]
MPFEVYERYNLYITPDLFCIEPRRKDGSVVGENYLRIDRITNEVDLFSNAKNPIPIAQAEVKAIYGLWGIIPLLGGNYLCVITKASIIGILNGSEIYHADQSEAIPYQIGQMHLTQRQRSFNNVYVDMLKSALNQRGFYFSYDYDLSRSMQWLSENSSPDFRDRALYDRAAVWYLWNNYLISPLSRRAELQKYCLPIIHGFVGIRECFLKGHAFKLVIISRRPIERPGVRFIVRGVDANGSSANFVETEQIIEFDNGGRVETRRWTSLLQLRGSIPLLWSQKPNLKWQPQPYMRPQDDQTEAFVSHMKELRRRYGGTHVIVNLVNQKGREHSVGGELARVSLQASLDFVRYIPFDFHRECKNLNWSRLSLLRDTLKPLLREFGFFSSAENRKQKGFFRTNCMDCLDRTNVAQAMIAKESLKDQLIHLGIFAEQDDLDHFDTFLFVFRNLWADNGDEISRQYAGTGALKTDYTRVGKRTTHGAVQDGINALTRYYKNNFTDGYKLDAMNLLLGYYKLPEMGAPEDLDRPLVSWDANGFAVVGAVFSMAMTLLCVLISENMTATIFWFVIFLAFAAFIYLNGEEFVRKPKLKKD